MCCSHSRFVPSASNLSASLMAYVAFRWASVRSGLTSTNLPDACPLGCHSIPCHGDSKQDERTDLMGSPRIALVGAGSAVFARALIRDTYTFPELRDAELRLMDIDSARLADTSAIAGRLRKEYEGTGAIT